MKLPSLFSLVLGLITVLTLCSCGSTAYKNSGSSGSSQGTPSASPTAATVSFASVQSILNSQCISCHNLSFASGGVSLTSLSDIRRELVAGDPNGSLLMREIQSGAMPKGRAPLSAQEQSTIRQWIQEGALNN